MLRATSQRQAVAEPAGQEAIPAELVELMERVRQLPGPLRSELLPIVAEAQEQARYRGRVLAIAKEALVRLRLDLELARFDLDVTRKERAVLSPHVDI
jgi:hypothetical protein